MQTIRPDVRLHDLTEPHDFDSTMMGSVQNDTERLGLLVSTTRSRHKNVKLFLCCGVALLAAFSMGFGLGYSSPADIDLQTRLHLNKDQTSWFSALFTVGAVFGGPVGGFLVGRYGRKLALMSCSAPLVVGWVLLATCTALPVLYLGRILTGLGAGMASLATPVYIAEMSSPQLRGVLGASFQLMVTIGICVVYALGLPLDYVWLAIVGAAVAAVLVVAMSVMPDTPRFYLSQHKRDRALQVLHWLRGKDVDVDAECREVEGALDNSNEKFSLREFGDRTLFTPLFISVMLMVFQQCSGINAVMFNAKEIMLTATQGIAPDVASVILGAVQVVATFVSVLLMDLAGRKLLLIVAGILMAISSSTLGLYYQLKEIHDNNQTTTDDYLDWAGIDPVTTSVPGEATFDLTWLSLVSLIVYITGFSIGWGPVPWLVMSEIFPTKAKGVASAIATATNWLFAFVITKTFEAMRVGMTDQGVFWFYAGICIISIIFVVFFVPETKGKTLEEIEAIFSSNTPPATAGPDQEENQSYSKD